MRDTLREAGYVALGAAVLVGWSVVYVARRTLGWLPFSLGAASGDQPPRKLAFALNAALGDDGGTRASPR